MAQAIKNAAPLLMPKATAVWLIENTALTFRQIADFTDLTELEIEALANQDIGRGLVGRNPIENGELTREDLARCGTDPDARLKHVRRDLPTVKVRAKGPRYTPVSKRGDKPDAIAYILKQNPDMKDAAICRLVGTTKPTIAAVRDRSHPNAGNLRPRHPAELGLCTYAEYEKAANKALKAAGKDPEKIKAEKDAEAARAAKEQEEMAASVFDFSNFLRPSSTQSYDDDSNRE